MDDAWSLRSVASTFYCKKIFLVLSEKEVIKKPHTTKIRKGDKKPVVCCHISGYLSRLG
jgi:hypothetical protein